MVQIEEQIDRDYIESVLKNQQHNVLSSREAVPSIEVAIQVALSVWTPIYGSDFLEKEKPFRAARYGDYWLVQGSLPLGRWGGTAMAVIRAQNAEVLNVSHGK
jgi:NTF2 fold immunity protein